MGTRWYSINSVKPACTRGNVNIDYDPEEDVLLVSLADSDPELNDKVSIANSEMRVEREKNVVITFNRIADGSWFISSIALTNASHHPLWAEIFRGLEFALKERKALHFTIDPSHWKLK